MSIRAFPVRRVRDGRVRAAEPLDIPSLARIAHVSEAHFIRNFHGAFGETPHRYLLLLDQDRAR